MLNLGWIETRSTVGIVSGRIVPIPIRMERGFIFRGAVNYVPGREFSEYFICLKSCSPSIRNGRRVGLRSLSARYKSVHRRTGVNGGQSWNPNWAGADKLFLRSPSLRPTRRSCDINASCAIARGDDGSKRYRNDANHCLTNWVSDLRVKTIFRTRHSHHQKGASVRNCDERFTLRNQERKLIRFPVL
jgi:hypothetical protein